MGNNPISNDPGSKTTIVSDDVACSCRCKEVKDGKAASDSEGVAINPSTKKIACDDCRCVNMSSPTARRVEEFTAPIKKSEVRIPYDYKEVANAVYDFIKTIKGDERADYGIDHYFLYTKPYGSMKLSYRIRGKSFVPDAEAKGRLDNTLKKHGIQYGNVDIRTEPDPYRSSMTKDWSCIVVTLSPKEKVKMPLDPEKVTGIVEKNWPSFASTREPARGLWINKGYPFRSYVTKDGAVALEFDILHRRMNIADEYLEAYVGEWKKNFNSENGFSDDVKKYVESVLQQSGVDFSRVDVKRNMESERDFGPRALRVTVYPPVASAAAKK